MTIITEAEALAQLNHHGFEDLDEIGIYLDAANEWVGDRVDDTSLATAKLAALFLIDFWWESQRGPVAAPFDDASGEFASARGATFAIPNKVLDLLGLKPNPSPTGCFPDAVAYPDPVEWI